MARGYQAETVYIASIYPGELQPIKKWVGPDPDVNTARCTTYELTPVKRGGKPCVIEVCDSFENILAVAESTERGNKSWTSKLVPHEQITGNLLNEWTGNMVGVSGSPGIMLLKGTVPHSDEIRHMMSVQTLFAEYFFAQGEKLWRQNEYDQITPTMRVLSEWLGRKTLWADPAFMREREEAAALNMVSCPSCYTQIDSRASKCPQCQTVLKALPAEIALLNVPVSA